MDNTATEVKTPQNAVQDPKIAPIKVLALCDSPTSATGFAQVAKNILNGLVKTGRYEIDVVGINYFGDYYDREKFPYNIYPAQPQGYNDMYGRGRVLNAINGHEAKNGLNPPWDIVFTIQDPFIIEGLGISVPFGEQLKVSSELWKRMVDPELWFTWIGYFPVDSDLKENWVTRSIALCDYPVAYCDWGKEKILKYDREAFETTFNLKSSVEGKATNKARLLTRPIKDRLSVIHHGVDLQVFHPIPTEEKKAFRKEFLGDFVNDDTYLVVNVSRNQPRKDLCRTLQVFSIFKKKVPNAHLYLHCKDDDVGGSIHEMARNYNLIGGQDYSVPKDFNAGSGYPPETVNKIYNMADLCITTTLGEGWGFITTEAMATKTPIVAPYITSMIDIFGSVPPNPDGDEFDNWEEYMRGIPVKAGSTTSEFICMGLQDNERVRPLTNVDDMVEKMFWAYKNPEKVQAIVERAFAWVQDLQWSNIAKMWDVLFTSAYLTLQEKRKQGKKIDEVGRNEPCPCNSGKKYKKCHGSPENFDKFNDWIIEGGEQ